MKKASGSVDILMNEVKVIQQKMRLLQDVGQAECCFVLGVTGSGKSTTISIINGAQLQYTQRYGQYLLSHNNKSMPQIGNLPESCTTVPSIYPSPDGTHFYDPPGFLDTKGELQETLNAYCNANMFKIGSKAKILIVIEQSSFFSGRGGMIADVATRLKNMFENDFKAIVNSCFLVVTKVQPRQKLQHFQGMLNDIATKNCNIPDEGKMLMRQLIHDKRIICIPTPDLLNQQIKINLRFSIRKMPAFSIVSAPAISLSPAAKQMIENLAKHLEEQKTFLAKKIGQEIYTVFRHDTSDKSSLEQAKSKLSSVRGMLERKELVTSKKFDELQKKLSIQPEHIQTIKNYMKQLAFCHTIYNNLNVFSKFEETLLISVADLDQQIQKSLSKICSQEEIAQLKQQENQKLEKQRKENMAAIIKMNEDALQRERRLMEKANEENQRIRKEQEQKQQKYQQKMDRERKEAKDQETRYRIEKQLKDERAHQAQIDLLQKSVENAQKQHRQPPPESKGFLRTVAGWLW